MSNLTMIDGTRIAGVSVSSVSRTLSGKPDAAEVARHYVRQVVDMVGYSPEMQTSCLRCNNAVLAAIDHPFKAGHPHIGLLDFPQIHDQQGYNPAISLSCYAGSAQKIYCPDVRPSASGYEQ